MTNWICSIEAGSLRTIRPRSAYVRITTRLRAESAHSGRQPTIPVTATLVPQRVFHRYEQPSTPWTSCEVVCQAPS